MKTAGSAADRRRVISFVFNMLSGKMWTFADICGHIRTYKDIYMGGIAGVVRNSAIYGDWGGTGFPSFDGAQDEAFDGAQDEAFDGAQDEAFDGAQDEAFDGAETGRPAACL